jgi:DNA-binding response OmpR family regulator
MNQAPRISAGNQEILKNYPSARRLRFGVFELDLQDRELRKCGINLRVQQKPFQVLELLVRNPGRFVTRLELAHHLWPDLHVSFDRSLNTAVNVLRQALGDSSRSCRYIETRSGFGYRFIADLEEISELGAGLRPPDVNTDSIAVLPFDNLATDPDIALLADGIV